ILRFGICQSGLDGQAVDQPPMGVEKVPPTLVVVPVFQPAEQALARREKRVGLVTHVVIVESTRKPDIEGRGWPKTVPADPQGHASHSTRSLRHYVFPIMGEIAVQSNNKARTKNFC